MPEIKNSTVTEQRAVFAAIDHIQDKLKEHPTVSSINKHAGFPPREARHVVNKMVREGLLTTAYIGHKEVIYKALRKR